MKDHFFENDFIVKRQIFEKFNNEFLFSLKFFRNSRGTRGSRKKGSYVLRRATISESII